MYVNSWWETEEDFKNWVNSDVFKQAHKKYGKSEDSPVIKSEIVKMFYLLEQKINYLKGVG